MKKLSGIFGEEKKRETTTLVLPNKKSVETVPRKIPGADYDFLREYAFKKNFTMLEATDNLYGKIKREIDEKTISFISAVDTEELESVNQKSIRLSIDFNTFLKRISYETNIPMKFIISFFIDYFKVELENELK